MDINRLREFAHLAETLSFAETSRAFFMSLSVLSKHIASMEDEMGCKLFIRDSHHVRLTDAGRSLKDDAQKIIAAYDAALTHLKAINDSYRAVITVGYLRNASRPFLAGFVKEMKKRYADYRVVLRCMEYGELNYALSAGIVDAAFGMDTEKDDLSQCDYFEIYQDRFDAVTSFDHPLASFDSVVASDLAKYRLILPDHEAYLSMSRFVKGFLPEAALQAPHGTYRDVDTLFLKVETERYVGFSSEHNYPLFSDKVKFVQIEDAATHYSVGAFLRKGVAPEISEAFIETVGVCREQVANRMRRRIEAGKFRF